MRMHRYPERIARRLGLPVQDAQFFVASQHGDWDLPERTRAEIHAVVRGFDAALGDAELHGLEAEAALMELKRDAGSRFDWAVVGEFLTIYRQDALDRLLGPITSHEREGGGRMR